MPGRIASSRASADECQSDHANCLRWSRKAIAACAPDSTYVRFLRQLLANRQLRAGKRGHAEARDRE